MGGQVGWRCCSQPVRYVQWFSTQRERERGVVQRMLSKLSKAFSRGTADESCRRQRLCGIDLRQALETFML